MSALSGLVAEKMEKKKDVVNKIWGIGSGWSIQRG